jgi:hypothetical protein
MLSGTASDNVGVTSVTWVNDRGGSGTATLDVPGATTVNWTVSNIALQPGVNNITVTAHDAAGNSSIVDVIQVTLDQTPPIITLLTPTTGPTYITNNPNIILAGTASDIIGLSYIFWTDNLGQFGACSGTLNNWATVGIVLPPGVSHLGVIVGDLADNTAVANLTVTLDTSIPVVTITSPTSGPTYTIATPFISLAGTAIDDLGLAQVIWSNNRGGSGVAVGLANWSVANIVLAPGENIILISAIDLAGNVGTATITVTYIQSIVTIGRGKMMRGLVVNP